MITNRNQSQFLAQLLSLMGRLIQVPKEEAGFIILNEINGLIPIKGAAIFQNGSLKGITSADKIVETSPVVEQWRAWYKNVSISEAELSVNNTYKALGYYFYIVPVRDIIVVFSRDGIEFSEHDVNALTILVKTYERVIHYSYRPAFKVKKKVVYGICAIFLISLIPFKTATHEKAEVDLYQNVSIKASMNGVIKSIDVEPNQFVHKGDVLVHFDDRQIQADLRVAEEELNIARAQYNAFLQQGMDGDDKSRNQVLIQQHKIDEERDRVAFQKSLLNKSVLYAPNDGVAMFSEKYALIGKNMAIGERIIELSAGQSKRLKIEVPTQDIITFGIGSSVSFFDNTNPLHAYHGTISYAPYQPVLKPDQSLVYEYKADLKANDRPGLQGTAVIYGHRIPLALWLLRKPIAFVRDLLG